MRATDYPAERTDLFHSRSPSATRGPPLPLGYVTMTIHKLTAGSGYEYLTRQVAAGDSTELGATALADYYEAKGEAPGRWAGSGLDAFAGPDGINAGDVVTAEQMGHLFGVGEHPVTGRPLGRRTRSDGVAGFDLTFSPVKSVSTLWAVAPPEIARAIEQAHDAAVNDAMAYVEREVLFTREGTDGARQVKTRGLIAAAFRHRDSRAGDPDLHTHVAVANKVQAKLSGKWLTVYGRLLFQHTVAISETYNTALEYRLGEALGVTFAERANPRERRAVREIVGVSAGLCRVWSRRARDIDRREDDLVSAFIAEHGRPPTESERLGLVQQANLETRAPKHEPRAEADQRRIWRRQASEFLGSESTLAAMIHEALDVSPPVRRSTSTDVVDTHVIHAMAVAVITELETRRATWQSWHLRAEAERQVRAMAPGQIRAGDLPAMADAVVAAAVGMSVSLTPDDDPIDQRTDLRQPSGLRRSGGTSVYRHTGADHYTSQRILQAEQRLVDAAGLGSDFAFSAEEVDIVLAASAVAGVRLNDGQHALVHALAGGGHRVRLALAPAGSGKTTAVEVLAAVWTMNGYDAIGLAPSAAAAKVLQEATGLPCETLAKIDDEVATQPTNTGGDRRSGLSTRIGPETLVVIDEAGMADTLTLDRVVAFCISRGATIRLLGDDQQLSAVGAGGVLRDITHRHGADRLEEVVRFIDPGEAAASLDLRDGDQTAIGFYLDHDRIHTADEDTTIAEVLAAWQHDRDDGLDTLMLAPTRNMAATLNHQARTRRLAGIAPRTEVELADGNQASVGDTIITRHNQRRLAVSGTDWVKNGDRWTITRIRGAALTVRHATTGLKASLPAEYVHDHVELGYASTVHTAQGLTADVVHGIVDGREDRQMLYTMLTRGRRENHVHLVLEPIDPVEADRRQCMLPGLQEQLTAIQILDDVVGRDGAAVSATTTLRRGRSWSTQLHDASLRYADAVATGAMRVLGSGWEDALDAAGEGPLPWLPAIPADLARDESWGPYLTARSQHVEVTRQGFLDHLVGADIPTAIESQKRPAWMTRYADVLGDLHDTVALWRAARGVPEDDPRPTGPAVTEPRAGRFQRHLLRQLTGRYSDSVQRWHELILRRTGIQAQDDHTRGEAIELARLLDTLHRRGHDSRGLLDRALSSGALPEGHAIAALTYRVRRLTPRDPLQSRSESAGHAGPSAIGM
ncbi:conjugative relaxase-like TrwC/TraI family protein [Nocardioides albertanoniae]|uniref:Conjugative relaxase-like TrwC/TraI family protein n=3 Tax=Nocardioides TaxID=1839 RepID=A0A543A3P7_9ACTN|nr:conjugative relaxase-like TrwC/TraI family protein [Nocardioides albertanoniae]